VRLGWAAVSANANQIGKELYEFGPFRVDAQREILLRAGETVALTPKTFQILLVLVRHSQEVVTKDDLMKTVWPDTFVEEANLSRNVFMLRKALGESPRGRRYIVTVPGRGYRLADSVHLVPEHELSVVAASHTKVKVQVREIKPWGWIAAVVVLLLGVAPLLLKYSLHRVPVLSQKDTLVLADFANFTGDAVFDGTLRQDLAAQLEQSPFLSLISEERIQQTLQLMGQPADARLTPQIAREVCQRTGASAVLDGSIASLGNQYVLGLKAANCRAGDTLAEEQATAVGKEQVLKALGNEAVKLRRKLGESLSTVEKFDTPIEQATTPSLEALQAYSLGVKAFVARDDLPAAILLFERAIRPRSEFRLGICLSGVELLELRGEQPCGRGHAQGLPVA
jgi:DNA-binding winged helix-turn-helix (wHTH) protein